MDPGAALVSVLIRSLGRPSLVTSVASAAAQTYRPLEIVIVNAGHGPLPSLAVPADVALRIVDAPGHDRPRAANAALAAARGDWLVFLDDDDVFLANHVETLLHALAAEPDALLAYSATECIDPAGNTVKILSTPFDRLALVKGNYIQIGAALFSRTIVDEGVRFDEGQQCLQDWDFWLQVAQRTRFVFTGLATNRWSAFSGDSGCGMGGNSDRARFGPYSRKLAAKWRAFATDLQRRVRHHQSLAQLAAKRGHLDEAERHAQAVETMLRGAPPRARRAGKVLRPPVRRVPARTA